MTDITLLLRTLLAATLVLKLELELKLATLILKCILCKNKRERSEEVHVEAIAEWSASQIVGMLSSAKSRAGTHITGNVPGGLGTLDGNGILSQVIVLHL